MSATSASGASVASARIGLWQIAWAPPQWFFVPDFGLKLNVPDPASNIHIKDDVLLAGDKLEPYIEAQKAMLGKTYDNPTFAGPQPTRLLAGQVDEAMLLLIRHQPMRGASVVQVQTYVRRGTWLGIITLTTMDHAMQQVRPAYEQFIASLTIAEEEPAFSEDADGRGAQLENDQP